MVSNFLQYLEASAQRVPEKVFMADDSCADTYSEFVSKARLIGSRISERVSPKNGVVILMDSRHVSCVEAMMGALYAGGFYIPLDPALPVERLQLIFAQLEPALIVYDRKAKKAASELADSYDFVEFEELLNGSCDDIRLSEIRSSCKSSDLLCILYTSGSTGIPKGVTHTHGQFDAYAQQAIESMGFDETTVFGNQSPYFYANSAIDLFPSIVLGATVYILSASLLSFPKKMVEKLREYKVTELTMTPSSYNAVADADVLEPGCLPDLKYIELSGERANFKAMKKWTAAACNGFLVNTYGSTEMLSINRWIVDREFQDAEIVPVGVPHNYIDIIFMDENGQEARPGEKGEILASNPFMSSGYYKDKERTQAAFVNDPLNRGWNQIYYHTGDIGYLNDRGELVVCGRKDNQIKHNGYRMELGEIEYAMSFIEGLKEGCCVYDPDAGCIVCFYTGDLTEKDLLAALRRILPRYAVPDRFIHLQEMPYNANVKIDRRKLAAMV